MTKRFSAKASDWTKLLGSVQQDIAKMKRQLAELEARERSLKAYLMPFYDEGKTEVDYGSKTMLVNYSVTQREYLDQDRAKAMILNMGKKIPVFSTEVVTFKVKG